MDPAQRNLSDPIFYHARTRPDAPAVIDGPNTLSYRALAALVAKTTVYLRDLGIGEGERVGLALTNSADHVVLTFALFRLGAAPVEFSPEDKAEALAAGARKYRIATFFTEPHLAAPPGVRRIRVDVAWRPAIARLSGDQRSASDSDVLHFIALTTGSTGVPSGWIMTHRNLLERVAAYGYGGWWSADRAGAPRPPGNLLVILPLHHVWSLMTLLAQLFVGGPIVLMPSYAPGPGFLRAIAAWPDAILCVTPNICRFLLRASAANAMLLPNLRRLETGGQPLYPDEKRAVIAQVTPNFFEVYGTTASALISGLSAAEMTARPDTVGRPPPGMTVEIVDPQGRPLPRGVAGEIRCRPYYALRECEEDGGSSAERLIDGWCYTADIGFIDTDGYIHLRGRGADAIRRGAVEIFAPEIEAVLAAHPAVAEAAVIGLRRPGQTERDEIVAFIVKRGEFGHDDLVQHCRDRLPPAQRPDRVYYADMLPRIAGGKLNRIRLEELAAEAEERRRG